MKTIEIQAWDDELELINKQTASSKTFEISDEVFEELEDVKDKAFKLQELLELIYNKQINDFRKKEDNKYCKDYKKLETSDYERYKEFCNNLL